ncbi:MAG TPA: transcriptional regulator [Gemmatimonadaceae bacterium]|nr:transcriptional regulator [Gemmatimonadaceae bacterium]
MADSNTARRRRSDPGGEAPRGRALGAVRADGPPAASEESRALDALIHHRMRLGIVSALAAEESLTFNELKSLLRTTDGNLSVHARKLEDADYVTVTKRFEDRRPRTEYRLTAAGRKALQRYLDHMEALIRATRDTLQR